MDELILGDKKISLPSSWDHINTGQFIRLRSMKDQTDFCELLSILTGLSYKDIFDCEVTEITMQQIKASLEWMSDKIDFEALPVPVFLEIGKQKIKVVQDLGTKSIGQKMFFQQKIFPFVNILDEGGKKSVSSIEPECIPMALAIYFQPTYTCKRFDPDSIDELVELCGEISITKASAVASFFLKKYFGLSKENLN